MTLGPEIINLFISGVGIGAAIVSVYVKLSLPDYTIRVLNGRYPTSAFMDARLRDLEHRIEGLRDGIETRLDTILCGDCPLRNGKGAKSDDAARP